jgi:hypothetical protein
MVDTSMNIEFFKPVESTVKKGTKVDVKIEWINQVGL